MNTSKLVAALLAAIALTGCGAVPTAMPTATETRLSLSKPKKTAQSATPVAARGVAAAPDAPQPPAAAPAAAQATPAATAPAVLTLIAAPRKPIQLAVFRGPKNEAVDLMADPEDGLAGFTVQAPPGGVVVAKAVIAIEGAGDPVEVTLDRAALEWPPTIYGRVDLGLPVLLYETIRALNQAPATTQLAFRATLYGPDGTVINGPDGEPVRLEAQAMVF